MFSLAYLALAAAQVADAQPVTPVESPAVVAEPATLRVAALTPIHVIIRADLSGRGATTGQEFDLVLAYPVAVGDRYVIPAGTPGRGWVVHANSPKLGGKAGELVLGARYLMLGDVQIPLRSLKVGGAGKDNTGVAMGVMAAAGVAGVFISGGDARVSNGVEASAKIAADVDIPVSRLTPVSAIAGAPIAVPAPTTPTETK